MAIAIAVGVATGLQTWVTVRSYQRDEAAIAANIAAAKLEGAKAAAAKAAAEIVAAKANCGAKK